MLKEKAGVIAGTIWNALNGTYQPDNLFAAT